METGSERGPEYVPLPAARADAQAQPLSEARLPRVPHADPSPGKLLAIVGGTVAAGVVAAAVAGGALWHYVAARAPAPAAPAAIAAAAPDLQLPAVAPEPAAEVSAPEPSHLFAPADDAPRAPLHRASQMGSGDGPGAQAAAPAPSPAVPPALPEPPTSVTPSYVPNAEGAIAAQRASLSPAETASLFNGSSGNFAVSNPAGRSVTAGVPGACPACDNAMNASGTARVSGGPRVTVGTVQFVGPCREGYVYRLTNLSQGTLPNAMVADDGQVWRTGRLGPGQSIEIRSKTIIHRTTAVNLP